jgi:hypothetical protein
MRTASRGLIIAYGMLAVGWLFIIQIAPRVLPGIGKFGFVVLVGGPFIIVHGVALAIFTGSLVCAGRSLYLQSSSRTWRGYVVFALSGLPVLALAYLWFRLMVIGH